MVGRKMKIEEKENTAFQMSAYSFLLVLDYYLNNGNEPSGQVPLNTVTDRACGCSDP